MINLSELQIASIVREYNKQKIAAGSSGSSSSSSNNGGGGNRNLDLDLQTYFTGDIRGALRAKCMEKYYFLASRIYADKESIGRFLSSSFFV